MEGEVMAHQWGAILPPSDTLGYPVSGKALLVGVGGTTTHTQERAHGPALGVYTRFI